MSLGGLDDDDPVMVVYLIYFGIHLNQNLEALIPIVGKLANQNEKKRRETE